MAIGEDDPPDPFMVPPPRDVIFDKFAYLEKRIDRNKRIASSGVGFGAAAMAVYVAREAFDVSYQTAYWVWIIAFIVALLAALRVADMP